MSHPQKTPRLGFAALQHMQIPWPFFSLGRLTERPIGVTLPIGSPALRVWLPSRRYQLTRPLVASFSSQRSWALPFRALLLLNGQQTVSRKLFRSCAFVQNLLSLTPALQRFTPIEEAVPLCATRMFNSDRGQVALLGFRSLGLSLR